MFFTHFSLRKKIRNSIIFASFFSSGLFFVSASDLSLRVLTQVPRMGAPVSLGVYVENNKSAINAVSLDIGFDTKNLSVQSISKKDTLIQMWSENPRFSNSDGSAHVEGVILNPGFTGSSGLLATVLFSPKKEGKTTLTISGAHVYANDGNATDVIKNVSPLSFTIGPSVVSAVKEVRTEENVATTSQPAKLTTGPVEADQSVVLDETLQVVSSSTSSKVFQTIVIEDAYDKPKYTKYVLSLNGKEKMKIDASILGKTLVLLPKADLRANVLSIIAYDAYGGATDVSVPFYVDPLHSPELVSLSRSVFVGENVKALFRSEKGGSIRVTLKNENSLFISDTTVAEDGTASISLPVNAVGSYKGVAKLYQDGGESEDVFLGDVKIKPTLKWFFSAENPSRTLFFMSCLLVVLICLLVVLIVVRRYKRKIREMSMFMEKKDAESAGTGTAV